MEEPRFVVNTVMTGEDYRKFLYIATFKRNKLMLPLLGLIALAGSMIVSISAFKNFIEGKFNGRYKKI